MLPPSEDATPAEGRTPTPETQAQLDVEVVIQGEEDDTGPVGPEHAEITYPAVRLVVDALEDEVEPKHEREEPCQLHAELHREHEGWCESWNEGEADQISRDDREATKDAGQLACGRAPCSDHLIYWLSLRGQDFIHVYMATRLPQSPPDSPRDQNDRPVLPVVAPLEDPQQTPTPDPSDDDEAWPETPKFRSPSPGPPWPVLGGNALSPLQPTPPSHPDDGGPFTPRPQGPSPVPSEASYEGADEDSEDDAILVDHSTLFRSAPHIPRPVSLAPRPTRQRVYIDAGLITELYNRVTTYINPEGRPPDSDPIRRTWLRFETRFQRWIEQWAGRRLDAQFMREVLERLARWYPDRLIEGRPLSFQVRERFETNRAALIAGLIHVAGLLWFRRQVAEQVCD
ncbi:unnamed protein product [Zymoseptoria tritici ST99CH_3D1]|nr:unnamed protein product [Zymoseptoria tritici ST99CH_3D1]